MHTKLHAMVGQRAGCRVPTSPRHTNCGGCPGRRGGGWGPGVEWAGSRSGGVGGSSGGGFDGQGEVLLLLDGGAGEDDEVDVGVLGVGAGGELVG